MESSLFNMIKKTTNENPNKILSAYKMCIRDRVDGYLVIGLVAIRQTEIIILRLQINERKNQFFLKYASFYGSCFETSCDDRVYSTLRFHTTGVRQFYTREY